jgi:hypothetical protein
MMVGLPHTHNFIVPTTYNDLAIGENCVHITGMPLDDHLEFFNVDTFI